MLAEVQGNKQLRPGVNTSVNYFATCNAKSEIPRKTIFFSIKARIPKKPSGKMFELK